MSENSVFGLKARKKDSLYLLNAKYAFLGVPVSADVKHIQTFSTNYGIVHLCISAYVGIHSLNPAN